MLDAQIQELSRYYFLTFLLILCDLDRQLTEAIQTIYKGTV